MILPLEALKPLGLVSVRVASYQSVSGAGKEAIEDLKIQSYLMIFSGFYLENALILAATLFISVLIRPSLALFFGVGFFFLSI
jgi:aspartate-semialdehyde dehydrogenase